MLKILFGPSTDELLIDFNSLADELEFAVERLLSVTASADERQAALADGQALVVKLESHPIIPHLTAEQYAKVFGKLPDSTNIETDDEWPDVIYPTFD